MSVLSVVEVDPLRYFLMAIEINSLFFELKVRVRFNSIFEGNAVKEGRGVLVVVVAHSKGSIVVLTFFVNIAVRVSDWIDDYCVKGTYQFLLRSVHYNQI